MYTKRNVNNERQSVQWWVYNCRSRLSCVTKQHYLVGVVRIVFVPKYIAQYRLANGPVNKLTNGSSGKWASSCGVACVVERELCPLSGNADTI